jgi:hypothetical protein
MVLPASQTPFAHSMIRSKWLSYQWLEQLATELPYPQRATLISARARRIDMKRLMGLAVLALSVAVSAHAQATHTVTVAGQASTMINASGGGGWGFGGGSARSRPPSSPPAVFRVTSISGSHESYEPSTFVSYDQALRVGKNLIDTPPPSVAEAARQQASAHPQKAKLALVQDADGRAQLVRR